ncbi:MAG: ABC transporter ATP-binding protein [Lachnospiraceae bacterium]|nr:ABC transporter ATP-binding protein [Lachnospiraceae bacterium]
MNIQLKKGVCKEKKEALKWLMKYISPMYACINVFFYVLKSITNLLILSQIGEVIEHIVLKDKLFDFNQYFYMALFLVFINVLADYVICKLKAKIQEEPIIKMKKDLLCHLLRLGIPYYEESDKGYVYSLFSTSAERVKWIYENNFPEIINTSIQTILTVILFVAYMGNVGWLFLLCMIPSIYIQMSFNEIISKLMKLQIDQKQEFDKNVYHAISAIKEVRANQGELWQEKIISKSYEKYRQARMKTIDRRYKRGAFFRINIGVSLTLYYSIAIWSLSYGKISMSAFVTCSLYCASMIYVFNGFIFNITELIPNFQSVRILKEFINLSPKVPQNMSERLIENLKEGIQIDNLSFSYKNDHFVIRDFSLFVKKGEKVMISGTSGAGKTTLLKLMAAFYVPTIGTIRWDGQDYNEIDRKCLNEKIGYMFQETYLFGSSILENIRMGRSEAAETEIIEAAKLAGIDEFVSKLPEGYNTEVGERGTLLSGGQRQRIALARLFLKKPEVILMDEATANLDAHTAEKVMCRLFEVFEDKTIIAISHRKAEVQFFDRVILLNSRV